MAPVYENTQADENGNAVRNGIFLPGDENDIWIDYLSGKQYRGGQVLSNYDAPIWKLPVFVKANAIVPMYEANNNPQAQTADNEKGLDKTRRITEFFATEGSGSYTGFEDDGTTVVNTQDSSDEAYGTQNSISYGEHVSTLYTSEVSGGTGVFTINASTGTYDGYDPVRVSTFVVNLSAEPTALVAKNGEQALELVEVADKAAFDATEPEAGQAIYLYDETPNLNTYCLEGEGFADTEITTTPMLYVKFAETDVSQTTQTLTVEGFANADELPNDAPNDVLYECKAFRSASWNASRSESLGCPSARSKFSIMGSKRVGSFLAI